MVEKETVRRAYDGIAETYAAHRSADPPELGLLGPFLDALPERPRVLDAGCGQGDPVLARLDRAASPVGVDFSREQLRLAAAVSTPLVQGDLAALPFDAGAFDAVVAYYSLIHIPRDEHRTVVDEFARVLHPGGRLLLHEGTTAWEGTNPDWLDTGVEMQWHIAGAETTRDHLRDAGFTVVETHHVPETLEEESEDGDRDLPWVFFVARLDA